MISKKISLLSFSILTLIHLHSSSINPPECGRRINENNKWQNRIIGGGPANPEDWGWQALIEYDGSFICGASLINKEWIVTAAHCITSLYYLNRYLIRLGIHYRSNPESYSVEKKISGIIVHPKYNPTNYHNDIALIKLSSHVEFSDQIIPVCLPDQNLDFTNKKSWATGWGSTSEYKSDSYSSVLKELETKILNKTECEERYKILNPPLFDSTINICAGGQSKSICFGDSGGPLVVKVDDKWQLAGISSSVLIFSYRSCFDGGVFTKTSVYIDWIKEKIQDSSTDLFNTTTSLTTTTINLASTASLSIISTTTTINLAPTASLSIISTTKPSLSTNLTSKFPFLFNSSSKSTSSLISHIILIVFSLNQNYELIFK
ncbi:unnamed protein product [Brachionus calyciflorus]|uniref:Peptidase S1 domain-containing protein n=1 Tax=Brachionus calyciflorus TaxID=104777 RepID=A0A813PGB3_9BILA|nr:unnamed protein product [Brachionus calyciflorus]